jgi:urease accessory protein
MSERETAARLVFERVGPRSVVGSAFARSPLRILTPRNHGHAAWAYTSTLGGGLVDGDRLQLGVRVRGGAAAVLATQGETRVYRSPHGCRSELLAVAEEDALLAVLPDPTVCFAGACYSQRTDLRLAPGAALVFVDLLSAGRSARGERWAFQRYAGELTLRLGDRVLLAESTLLDPEHGPIGERFGRFDVLATLLLAGERLRSASTALAEKLRALPAPPRAVRLESANDLGDDVLLVRMAAVSLEDALRSIRDHLHFLPALLGDDPWARRP